MFVLASSFQQVRCLVSQMQVLYDQLQEIAYRKEYECRIYVLTFQEIQHFDLLYMIIGTSCFDEIPLIFYLICKRSPPCTVIFGLHHLTKDYIF